MPPRAHPPHAPPLAAAPPATSAPATDLDAARERLLRSTGAGPSALDPLHYSPRARWQRRKHLPRSGSAHGMLQWLLRAEALVEGEATRASDLVAIMDDLRLQPCTQVAKVRSAGPTPHRAKLWHCCCQGGHGGACRQRELLFACAALRAAARAHEM